MTDGLFNLSKIAEKYVTNTIFIILLASWRSRKKILYFILVNENQPHILCMRLCSEPKNEPEDSPMNRKTRLLSSVIINLIVAAATTGVITSYFMGNITNVNFPHETLYFFTTDSNIIAAVGCVLTAAFEIAVLRGKRDSVPEWVRVIKYSGMVSLLLTFLTVIVFLLPLFGEETVTGTSFHMHIAAPLLTFASFVLLENDKKLGFSRIFCGMAPMLVYAAVYVLMAVVIGYGNGGWTDFYSFNRNGMWYVTLVMMTSVTFVLCASTRLLHNHILSHRNKRASVAVLPGAASFGK